MKLLFAPIGIGAGLVAGFAAQKVFDRVWAAIDDENPPEPDTREVSIPKMVGALALEGAIFRLAKGFAEHGARSGFAALTGRWPGEERPQTD
jgi:hypothetical protein